MNLTAQLYEITKNLTVLYVEDNTELLIQMKNILDQLFQETHTAENGQLGLDAFKQKLQDDGCAYDMVITDIKMPLMNGIEMVEEIYKIVPHQPIIITSAHNDAEYLLPLLNMGINGFLVKPLTLVSMTKTLYTIAKSIENEYLLQEQYKEMKQLNEALKEKNIAIEKSLRIIEGLHNKEQLNNNSYIDISYRKKDAAAEKKELSKEEAFKVQTLTNIEFFVCNISMKYHLQGIENEWLIKLSKEIDSYAHLLKSQEYKNIQEALYKLSKIVIKRPQCTKEKELTRIFTMLESFFFIYTKWQNRWDTLNDIKFELSSKAMEKEIETLIALWTCKL